MTYHLLTEMIRRLAVHGLRIHSMGFTAYGYSTDSGPRRIRSRGSLLQRAYDDGGGTSARLSQRPRRRGARGGGMDSEALEAAGRTRSCRFGIEGSKGLGRPPLVCKRRGP